MPEAFFNEVMNGNIGECGKAADIRPDGFIFQLPVEIVVDISGTGTDHDKIGSSHLAYEIGQCFHRCVGIRGIDFLKKKIAFDFVGKFLQ